MGRYPKATVKVQLQVPCPQINEVSLFEHKGRCEGEEPT